MDYSYMLAGEENLVVIMLNSYKKYHPDAFVNVVSRTDNGDGSTHVSLNEDELEKVMYAAIREYTERLEGFDADLAKAFKKIDAHMFLVERGKNYAGDFYHYVGEKL